MKSYKVEQVFNVKIYLCYLRGGSVRIASDITTKNCKITLFCLPTTTDRIADEITKTHVNA